MRRRGLAGILALWLGLASGCIARPTFMQPAPQRELSKVLADARAAQDSGRYADADRLLADFAGRYPGSPEALETTYWRALVQLDPANQSASVPGGIAELDQYLAGGPKVAHYEEAGTLRRLAMEVQAATRLAATSLTTQTSQAHTAAQASSMDDKARDAEIQRLKDALAKANDELDRIKRRLTTPTPTRP